MQGFEDSCLKFSKLLAEKVKESFINKNEKYQFMNLKDDVLLAWCKEESCLYVQILQRLPVESDAGSEYKIQCLTLSKPPIWDIYHININKSGSAVLLIGKEGVGVVELPKRWGNPPLFEGGSDILTCRVDYIGEQFFMCNPNVKILSAEWHPGSLDHKSVIVLSSDNYLRIYNLLYLDIPEQAISLGKHSKPVGEVGRIGIEETAVAFGIGPPLSVEEADTGTNNTIDKIEEQKQKFQDLQWPLFILYNNGDLYYTITSVNRKRIRKRLYGPISMVPSSFDNYGLDFCSLLVLPSSPIVLVIANSKGYIHHCIVLEDMIASSKTDKLHSMEDLAHSVGHLNLEASNLQLHVYESVHLNLDVSDSFKNSSPLLLLADPASPTRYWVLHNQGVHGVSLPLIESLLLDGEEFPNWDLVCHVEHFISTRPSKNVDTCCVVGLATSSTPYRIFVLLNTGVIHVIPLPSLFIPNFSYNSSDQTNKNNQKSVKEPFEDYVRSILQRTLSQPLLVSGSNPEIDADEYLTIVSNATDNLRKNYIKPQIKAREQIQRRQKLLIEQKEHLRSELKSLESEKGALTEKAHQLAEKYEEANDRHMNIMKRLESIIGKLIRRIPILSANELSMSKELEEMMEKSKNLSLELSQIKSKHEWQQKQIENQKKNELDKPQKTTLSDNQVKCLKMSLSTESEKLVSLVAKIKQLKKELAI